MPRTTGGRSRRKFVSKIKHKPKKLDEIIESDVDSDAEMESNSDHTTTQEKQLSQTPEDEYKVEEIRDHRDTDKGREYFIKWEGWASDTNTWEPVEHLSHCKHLVTRYEKKQVQTENDQWEDLTMDVDGNKNKKRRSKKSKKTYGNRISNRSRNKNAKQTKSESQLNNDSDDEEDDQIVVSPPITTKRQRKKSIKRPKQSSDDEEACPAMDEVIEEVNDDEAESESEEEHYEVEYVVKHRKSLKKKYPKFDENGDRCYEYFVKWKNWDSSTNTWEHQDELSSCKKLINAFWEKRERVKAEKEKKKKEKQAAAAKKKRKSSAAAAKIKKSEKMPKQESENEEEAEIDVVIEEVVPIKDEKIEKIVKDKKKIVVPVKKKYKAKRVMILSDTEDEDEEEEEVQSVRDGTSKIDLNESAASRKRSYSDSSNGCGDGDEVVEDDEMITEPPLKKRKFEETKKIIIDKGMDLFMDMLQNGDEEIQNALVDLVQKFESN